MEWPQWGQMPRPCVLLDAFLPLELITPTLPRIQERSDSDLEGHRPLRDLLTQVLLRMMMVNGTELSLDA